MRADRATAETITSVVAAERTGMVASLIRLTGDWDLAEDCVQDAVERALVHWPREGIHDRRRPGWPPRRGTAHSTSCVAARRNARSYRSARSWTS
jgi:RNA polymerase sigma-70 factor, ECF subfamily